MLARMRPYFVLIGLLFLVAGMPLLEAQIHGVPASVTSLGFGGSTSFTPGIAASVTSLGPNGFGNSPGFGNCCFNAFRVGSQPPIFVHPHRGHGSAFFPVVVPVYTVPYTQVVIVQPETVAYDEEDSEGGPTIFDRRGSRSSRFRERVVEAEPAPTPSSATAPAPPEPVVPQPSTLLVFKDGHQTEVQNYAIVGGTLFELADNRSHKILLADLDLLATRKANDARGVDFQVPPD
ncbi:MAG: hypothetical protein HY233_02930, partial [Acidobacteriales bacterium]|nr:hypothetical protein [Terriglobales bacterium]